MNRPESNNDFTLNGAGLGYRSARTATGAHPRAEETRGPNRSHKFIKAVPFNGLLTNKLLTTLPGEDFARLLPHLEPVSLACGEDLYGFGEAIRDVYLPESAVLSHLYILEDGSTTEAAMIGKEGVTGLSAIFDSPAPTYWTQVIIPGTALRMSAEILKQEFARGQAMQRLLLSYASARIAHLSQRAVCNSRHTVEERLCSWLLLLHDRVGDDQLPLTHEQISRHLGTRRAGITNAATALRDRQVLSYSRGQISILDRRGLEMAACECYRTLNQQNLSALRRH
ncbi:MAG TPA: Crp/Fnr family transcriptional regulator [Pyrinomonadaceae bacterium]